MKSALIAAALFALPHVAGAQSTRVELPLVPTDGECVVTHQFEDGSATAQCGHETWAYDADGGFIYDHGIKFVYRAEGTWYEVSK